MNGLFEIFFTLLRPVRNQPGNVTCGAVFSCRPWCSTLVLLFPIPPGLLPILWWLYRARQLQLLSPSPSCSVVFSVLLPGLGTYLSFCFLSIVTCGQLERQSSLFTRFSFCCWLSLGLVVWLSRLDDPILSQNLRELLYVSFSRPVVYIPFASQTLLVPFYYYHFLPLLFFS